MIESGKYNKNNNNQDKCNHCNNFPLLIFFGVNHCLNLLHMSKNFVYLYNVEEFINEFEIGYMVNPTLYVYKAFKEQVEKFMNDKFVSTTQPFIKNIMKKYLCFSIINIL